MSPRVRVIAIAAGLAALSAAAVVGITALQSDRPAGGQALAGPDRRPGSPPLSLDLGVRTDPEAVALRRALMLYGRGETERARALFDEHDSLEARVGQAFVRWPDGTVERLAQMAALHPKRALVQLNLGVALFWSGAAGAQEAWRAASGQEPDSPYAVAAGNLLYPNFARNLPVFVPEQSVPRTVAALSPPRQLQELERRARGGRTVDRLFYGVALQRLGKPVSAERVFAAAARAAPGDAQAQVAAAVGRFDKARPAAAFSRLGPLSRRFPNASTVRFHLGLLLLWSGEVQQARRQLGLARTVQAGSPLAREAKRYLDELTAAGV